MKQREIDTAKHFGILERVEELEKKLLEIDHVVEVEFDLDCWSDLNQIIFLPKYDIPVSLPNYYDVRREMLAKVLETAAEFGLSSSGDRIEDYGEHFYIVRNCDESWQRDLPLQKTSDNEFINIWVGKLLERNGKRSLDELTPSELAEEIEEIKGTISNERLWAHADSIHEENVANLVEYLSLLETCTGATRKSSLDEQVKDAAEKTNKSVPDPKANDFLR